MTSKQKMISLLTEKIRKIYSKNVSIQELREVVKYETALTTVKATW